MLPAQSWNSSQTRMGFSVFWISAAMRGGGRSWQGQHRGHGRAEAHELAARDAAGLELLQEPVGLAHAHLLVRLTRRMPRGALQAESIDAVHRVDSPVVDARKVLRRASAGPSSRGISRVVRMDQAEDDWAVGDTGSPRSESVASRIVAALCLALAPAAGRGPRRPRAQHRAEWRRAPARRVSACDPMRRPTSAPRSPASSAPRARGACRSPRSGKQRCSPTPGSTTSSWPTPWWARTRAGGSWPSPTGSASPSERTAWTAPGRWPRPFVRLVGRWTCCSRSTSGTVASAFSRAGDRVGAAHRRASRACGCAGSSPTRATATWRRRRPRSTRSRSTRASGSPRPLRICARRASPSRRSPWARPPPPRSPCASPASRSAAPATTSSTTPPRSRSAPAGSRTARSRSWPRSSASPRPTAPWSTPAARRSRAIPCGRVRAGTARCWAGRAGSRSSPRSTASSPSRTASPSASASASASCPTTPASSRTCTTRLVGVSGDRVEAVLEVAARGKVRDAPERRAGKAAPPDAEPQPGPARAAAGRGRRSAPRGPPGTPRGRSAPPP